VHQDLADLDALAAGAQRVLHRLTAADDGHAAEALGKVDAHVLLPRRRHNRPLLEWQVPQARLNHLLAAYLGLTTTESKQLSICASLYAVRTRSWTNSRQMMQQRPRRRAARVSDAHPSRVDTRSVCSACLWPSLPKTEVRTPHQPQQAVRIEDKVRLVRVAIADDGVHAPDLEVGRREVKVVVDAPQIVLLQLQADMLRDQVDGNDVFILPTCSMPHAAGMHVLPRLEAMPHSLHASIASSREIPGLLVRAVQMLRCTQSIYPHSMACSYWHKT
jgi:hypothetical protein